MTFRKQHRPPSFRMGQLRESARPLGKVSPLIPTGTRIDAVRVPAMATASTGANAPSPQGSRTFSIQTLSCFRVIWAGREGRVNVRHYTPHLSASEKSTVRSG